MLDVCQTSTVGSLKGAPGDVFKQKTGSLRRVLKGCECARVWGPAGFGGRESRDSFIWAQAGAENGPFQSGNLEVTGLNRQLVGV